MLSQFLLAAFATAVLACIIHFPDVARRPTPPPTKLLFSLLIAISIAIIAFAVVGARSARAHTAIVLWCSLVLWLLGCYALIFVWFNTFGT